MIIVIIIVIIIIIIIIIDGCFVFATIKLHHIWSTLQNSFIFFQHWGEGGQLHCMATNCNNACSM